MPSRVVSLVDSANLPANQWRFSLPIDIPERIQDAVIQVTDPSGMWFTTPGFVKTWGLQLQGYVGGSWDNVAPWAGWGWWLYEPGGDPRTVLVTPQLWVPFGRHAFKGNGVGLLLGWNRESQPVPPGATVRLGIQVDTAITLGAQATVSS